MGWSPRTARDFPTMARRSTRTPSHWALRLSEGRYRSLTVAAWLRSRGNIVASCSIGIRIRTGGTTRSPRTGCWSRRTAPNGPGKARWKKARPRPPGYDPDCYLCPGNARAGGMHNPDYSTTFVFENDFAALKPATPVERFERRQSSDCGTRAGNLPCGVLLAAARSDDRGNGAAGLREVVDAWAAQYPELAANPVIDYVQIFENRGAMMGASNPHPHCQIWASRTLPNEVSRNRPPGRLARSGAFLSAVRLRGYRGRGPNEWSRRTNRFSQSSRSGRYGLRDAGIPKRHFTALDEFTETNGMDWRTFCGVSPRATTGCSKSRSRTPWVFTSGRATERRPGVAFARAFLSAAAALGNDPQVPGRIRDAGHAAARHRSRSRRRAPPRCLTSIPEQYTQRRLRAMDCDKMLGGEVNSMPLSALVLLSALSTVAVPGSAYSSVQSAHTPPAQ